MSKSVRKTMFIGASGSGKTTLYQRVYDLPLSYSKTQSLQFNDRIIDTPGEYLENRSYYSALLVTSTEVRLVALVMDCTDTSTVFPPGFSRMFNCPVIGLVTKVDLSEDDYARSYAVSALKQAGVSKMYYTSSFEDVGIDELRELILN